MDKRAPLRQYFDSKAEQAKEEQRYAKRTAQLGEFEDSMLKAFKVLIQFLDGKTTKTEIVNQLKSISTPDVDKVVKALEKLDANILANKIDTKPLEVLMQKATRELSLIPKTQAKFEQKESVKVTNLDEIKLDTSALEKAVQGLKLDPTIDVKAPIVNVEKQDLKPLQNVMLDLLKAVKSQKLEIPAFPEIPETDLSKVEKKLDESNKHLKIIAEKKGNSGGGGGNGTPYIDSTGKPLNVVLYGGGVPTVDTPFSQKITVSGSLTYIAKALPGTDQASALWQVSRVDDSVAGTTVITWADGNANFDNVATDLTVLSYS